ncbi:hypothetical protein AAG747_01300 [Rapidithrix thailandica]|uniref:SGNH hydrolase-type esterase domain-containing protein n=1 Tax=Rapidithrix thailandica TaxID=413964 RepID=A0AAW9S2B4_9BACT
MVKPSRILIILLYVGVMAGIIMLVSPGVLDVSPEYSLKVFTWSDAFENQKKADIDAILALEKSLDSLDAEQAEDSVASLDKKPEFKPVEVQPVKVPIEYPGGNSQALDNFYASLNTLASKKNLIRIVHYGDSQLEGDRITEFIRNRFQATFGGCGVGITPILEIKNARSTIYQEASDNWNKKLCYGVNRGSTKHSNYGLLGSYFQFPSSAWVKFSRSKYSYERNNTFDNIKLLYKNTEDTLVVNYEFNNASFGGTDSLTTQNAFMVHKIPFRGSFKNLKMNFKTNKDSELYGLAFDCNSGVAVDNVALRGSSGTEFTNINRDYLKTQFSKLNVKLIIIQFGVNVIPNVLTDYTYYENSMYRQLKYLKSLRPDLNILVVGVSDMARKRGPKYESYPNIRLVREAQRNAAFRANCAYWDLFTAMGGQNSMISWVHAKAPLANKDYTHFTRRGAKLVGEMVYNALMADYAQFQKRMAMN